MRLLFPYSIQCFQVALLLVVFLCFCGCSGCNKANSELEKATKILEKYKSLEIELNQLASDFEKNGHTAKQIQAESLRDQVGNYSNEMNRDYISKGAKQISQNMLTVWEDELGDFSLVHNQLKGSSVDEIHNTSNTENKLDADGDGVFDVADKCPNQFGERKDGCPRRDTDGDGINDEDDECVDKKGSKANRGCPVNTPPPQPPPTGSKGPLDSDGDGIYDMFDDCKLVYGSENCKGCRDTDNDGICDQDDLCDDEPGIAPDGCPSITCNEERRFTYLEESAICSPILKRCTLILRPNRSVKLEEFKVQATEGNQLVDYLLKENLGKQLYSRLDANTTYGSSQFLVDETLQANKTYQLILTTKGTVGIKTYCVSNFNNPNVQLSYTNQPFIQQITFCQ